jgi:AraC-like DNA-binding protein
LWVFHRCTISPNGGCRIASELLSGGNSNVATIAAESGYESEAAFSRAFKKMIGVPPSVWRHRIRPDPA